MRVISSGTLYLAEVGGVGEHCHAVELREAADGARYLRLTEPATGDPVVCAGPDGEACRLRLVLDPVRLVELPARTAS